MSQKLSEKSILSGPVYSKQKGQFLGMVYSWHCRGLTVQIDVMDVISFVSEHCPDAFGFLFESSAQLQSRGLEILNRPVGKAISMWFGSRLYLCPVLYSVVITVSSFLYYLLPVSLSHGV